MDHKASLEARGAGSERRKVISSRRKSGGSGSRKRAQTQTKCLVEAEKRKSGGAIVNMDIEYRNVAILDSGHRRCAQMKREQAAEAIDKYQGRETKDSTQGKPT